MIKITAIAPEINQLDVHPDLVIESINDYIRCYSMILEYIHLNKDFHVVVKDATTARWLQVMAHRYGLKAIKYEELSLRSLIEGRINLKIPKEISENEIRESGLLDLNIPSSGQLDIDEYLLEVFFGSFINKADMVFRFNEILTAYEHEQWQQALKRPLIHKIYQARLLQLRKLYADKKHADGLALLDWFEKSPEVFIRNLSALKLLQNYPEKIGVRVLGEVFKELVQSNPDLRRIPTVLQGNESTLDEIRIFLSLAETETDPDMNTFLNQISGYLEIELDTINRIIRFGKIEVTRELIQKIRRKFSALQSQPYASQILSDLELSIPVPYPGEPQIEWKVDEWLNWALNEYLPYRFWLESLGNVNAEVGELAGKYADWLYANYGNLLYNSSKMAWKAVLQLKEKISAHGGPVLLVMVDNLNPKFYPILQHQLHLRGFYEQESDFYISILPSFTEVGKKSIITAHYEPFEESSYANAVVRSWGGKVNKKVRYVANIQELRGVSEREHDFYILNYLPLDTCLHLDENQTGISHRQTIQLYLGSLVGDISSFARRINAERDLMVIITSDHGSTRIPKGEINVIEDKLYKKHATDEHHRFISISDEEIAKLTENVKYDCYQFLKEQYGLPENYLVARKLYRFLPIDGSSYIHGGLTPEETLIPVAVYLPVAVLPKPLGIRLVEPRKINAGTRTDLVFEITNLNNNPIEHVCLEIRDPNLEADMVVLDRILKLQRGTIRMNGRCHSSADLNMNKLTMMVSYLFNGREHENIIEIPIIYDTLIKVKFDFDNL